MSDSYLRKKARDRNSSMHLNAGAELYEIAMEQGHLSIELLFDAILVESDSWTITELGSMRHNLRFLAEALVKAQSPIHDKIMKAKGSTRADFSAISTAWRMQYRYEPVPWTIPKMQEYMPVFERQFQWIVENFRQSVSN